MYRRFKKSSFFVEHDDGGSDRHGQQHSSDDASTRRNHMNSSYIVTLVMVALTATFSSYFSGIYLYSSSVERFQERNNVQLLSDETLFRIVHAGATLGTNSNTTVIPLSKTDKKDESTTRTTIEASPTMNTSRNTIIHSHHDLTNNNSHIRVAYMISISNCPNLNSSLGTMPDINASVLDGPAVLAHSIRRLQTRYPNYHLVAVIHPRATHCTQHFHDNPLFGYDRAIVRDLGFDRSKIQNRFRYGSHHIDLKGCCGAYEFLKLEAYTFENDYDVVIHMDTDLLILKPMDDIIDTLVTGSVPTNLHTFNQQSIEKSSENGSHPDNINFVYTRDYIQMSKLTTDPTKYAVQGGFFAIRPNQMVYREMMKTIYKGEFPPKAGWGHEGYGGYYGAAQVQGFLSYIYGSVLPRSSVLRTESRSVELHPCYYNSMVISPPYTGDGICRYDSNITINTTTTTNATSSCPDCASLKLSELHSAHYTVCYKPWVCPLHKHFGPPCKFAHRQWFLIRQELEQQVWNQSSRNLDDDGWNTNITLGYCREPRHRGYVAMQSPHSGGSLIT